MPTLLGAWGRFFASASGLKAVSFLVEGTEASYFRADTVNARCETRIPRASEPAALKCDIDILIGFVVMDLRCN